MHSISKSIKQAKRLKKSKKLGVKVKVLHGYRGRRVKFCLLYFDLWMNIWMGFESMSLNEY